MALPIAPANTGRFVRTGAPAIVPANDQRHSPESAMLNAKSGPRIRHLAPESAPYEAITVDKLTPMGTILYITRCPPKGGDTLFANMYAAYEALSDRMKAYLSGLSAVHDGEHVYRGLFANFGEADRPTYPRAQHPVIRTHPVTGKK